MNQHEMTEFFVWCQENLANFEVINCDESRHFYLNEELIGGYAGDVQQFFYKQNDELAKALRMMDAANASEVTIH